MKTARHLHGQPIPDGWHGPIDQEYAYSLAGRVRISLNPQKGWVLEREEASGTFVGELWTWVPLYYGVSLAACAAWWAIEKSNEPAPSDFDVYAQMAKMVTPYTDIDQFFKLMQAAKS